MKSEYHGFEVMYTRVSIMQEVGRLCRSFLKMRSCGERIAKRTLAGLRFETDAGRQQLLTAVARPYEGGKAR